MTEQQSGQVTRIMDELKSAERDSRFEWCWVEISLHNHAGEITDFIPRGSNSVLATATIMHLIAKRMPRPQYKALDVYNSLMKPATSPLPRAPGLPPVSGGPPPGIIRLPPPKSTKKRSKYVSDTSDSDTDSTFWSSDSSVGNVRRRLRRYKAKKERKANRRRYCIDSDGEEEEEEEEDVIKIKVILKKGDDVVKKLLEMWTVDGKGKEKVV